MRPLAFSTPAGFSAASREAETLARQKVGFQPISAMRRIACAACLGMARAAQPPYAVRCERMWAAVWRSLGDSNPCFRRERATS